MVDLSIIVIRVQLDYNPHEKWDIVVVFLIGDMYTLKQTEWGGIYEELTNFFRDDLVGDLVVLTEDHQGILILLLFLAKSIVLCV